MLGIAESSLAVGVMVATSLGFFFLLDHFWPAERRSQHNDVIGWQVCVAGTTYAVIIGFMLYAVWTAFEDARGNADAEANALVNISRLAEPLPAREREQIRTISRTYAEAMVSREWPAMIRGQAPVESKAYTEQLWSVLLRDPNGPDALVRDHLLTELTNLTEHRRTRELEFEESLPPILWAVLTGGAILTISSSCLFGTTSARLHSLQVFGLSTLIAMSLMAIAEIDRPFQGSVHVSPNAFIRSQDALGAVESHAQSPSGAGPSRGAPTAP